MLHSERVSDNKEIAWIREVENSDATMDTLQECPPQFQNIDAKLTIALQQMIRAEQTKNATNHTARLLHQDTEQTKRTIIKRGVSHA